MERKVEVSGLSPTFSCQGDEGELAKAPPGSWESISEHLPLSFPFLLANHVGIQMSRAMLLQE